MCVCVCYNPLGVHPTEGISDTSKVLSEELSCVAWWSILYISCILVLKKVWGASGWGVIGLSLREADLPPRGSPRGPPKDSDRYTTNEHWIAKGASQRFSEVLSEFHSQSCCPSLCCPLNLLRPTSGNELATKLLHNKSLILYCRFCKSIAIQMGDVSWYKLVVYILLSAKRRAYFCKSIAVEMGGVSRYFSKVSGSGVDLIHLISTMLGVILSDHIPGDLNLTLTLTANSN